MAKTLYYASRVIHDPVRELFEVQYRKHWWSRWESFARHRYTPNGGVHLPSEDAARQGAETSATSLVAQCVVWQSSRPYG